MSDKNITITKIKPKTKKNTVWYGSLVQIVDILQL